MSNKKQIFISKKEQARMINFIEKYFHEDQVDGFLTIDDTRELEIMDGCIYVGWKGDDLKLSLDLISIEDLIEIHNLVMIANHLKAINDGK